MKIQLTLFPLILLFVCKTFSQTQLIKLAPNLRLPSDSNETQKLRFTLHTFLNNCEKSNEENTLVLESQKLETFLLMDEIRGIQKNTQNEKEQFYIAYLSNVSPLNEDQYLVQVAYLGYGDSIPQLKASFTLLAHKTKDGFCFSSPLLHNTRRWKSLQARNTRFIFRDEINKTKVNEYSKLEEQFDKKLKSTGKIVDMYCADNINELLKLIGVDYKLDYTGLKESVFSSKFENRKVIVLGNGNAEFSNFDPHDLWHDRLALVIPRKEVNKAVDEGCAYLYGGSWGFTWKEIFKSFKEQIAVNEKADWIALKENPQYFKTGNYRNSADYIVAALLVQKIEKEKGFSGVWEFLNCGKMEKGNQNFYKVLEQLTGITKLNYNEKVWELIRAENL